VLVIFVAACVLSGCSSHDQTHADSPSKQVATAVPPQLLIRSSAFSDGQPLPARFVCNTTRNFPPLSWSGVPAAAQEVAILALDPYEQKDVHWIVTAIPRTVTEISEGQLPAGAIEAVNSEGSVGWVAPCATDGKIHGLTFNVLALSKAVRFDPNATAASARDQLIAASIAQATVTGTFGAVTPTPGK
jgi:phosphatidylethanolamine-binding protein (PEBP) family uncharacterized protein